MALVAKFGEFSKLTGFQGFSFANEAAYLLEKIFWYMLILTGLFLTTWDFVKNVQQYLSEPTKADLEIVHSLSLPFAHLQFCVSIFTAAIEVDHINSAYDLIKFEPVVSSLDVFNETVVDDLLKHFDKMQNVDDYFRGAEFSLPFDPTNEQDVKVRGLLSLTIKMLGQIVRLESDDRRVQGLNIFADTRWGHGGWFIDRRDQYNNGQTATEIAPTVFKLYKFYRERNIDFVYLIRTVGVLLCKYMSMQAQFYYEMCDEHQNCTKISYQKNLCLPDRVSYFGRPARLLDKLWPDLLCFKLNLTKVAKHAFYNDNDAVHLGAFMYKFFNESQSKLFKSYIFFSEEETLDVRGDHLVIVQGNMPKVYVQLNNLFRAANLRRKPCSTAETHASCELKCRAQQIANACGCWPLGLFAVASKPQHEDYCISDRRYSADLNYVMPQLDKKECIDFLDGLSNATCTPPCYRQCERKVYHFEVINEPNQNDGFVEIAIALRQQTYAKFEETLLMDSTQLISNLGGILGIWVGASFISLIHVVVYCVKMLVSNMLERMGQAMLPKPLSSLVVIESPSLNLHLRQNRDGTIRAYKVIS